MSESNLSFSKGKHISLYEHTHSLFKGVMCDTIDFHNGHIQYKGPITHTDCVPNGNQTEKYGPKSKDCPHIRTFRTGNLLHKLQELAL